MDTNDDNSLVCEHCNNAVNAADDFCPECGILFIGGVICENHDNILAKGVFVRKFWTLKKY